MRIKKTGAKSELETVGRDDDGRMKEQTDSTCLALTSPAGRVWKRDRKQTLSQRNLQIVNPDQIVLMGGKLGFRKARFDSELLNVKTEPI